MHPPTRSASGDSTTDSHILPPFFPGSPRSPRALPPAPHTGADRRGASARAPTVRPRRPRRPRPRRATGPRGATLGRAVGRTVQGLRHEKGAIPKDRPVAGGPVSRVLSPGARTRSLAIYLGRASPRASSGQPGDRGEPGRLSLPIGPCTGWGLPSCPCCQRHWCALTAPFHPCCASPGFEGPTDTKRSALCCTCRRLTRPAVSWHPALWCPDFPQGALSDPPRPDSPHCEGRF